MQRVRVRKSPADFAEVASFGGFKRPWHIDLVNQKLLDVYNGKTKRLIISLPVRHGKSEIISRYTTAWWLMNRPTDRVVIAGYGSEFAAEWGKKSRDLVEEWGKLFDVGVDRRSASASRWNIAEHGGGLYAVGVGSSLTGRGANCLVGDSKVTLYDGSEETIENITIGTQVVSYNIQTKNIEPAYVQAIKRSQGFGIYRLTTTSGRVVETTGNHPIYTQEHGWRFTSELTPGDHLVCVVSQGLSEAGVRHEQVLYAGQEGRLLLAGMLSESSCNQKPSDLRILPNQSDGQQDTEVLFGLPRSKMEKGKDAIRGHMSHLPGKVSSTFVPHSILQPTMRQRVTFTENEGQEQPPIHSWTSQIPRNGRVAEGMEDSSAKNIASRLVCLRGLCQQEEAACASQGCKSSEQRINQSDHALRNTPHRGPSQSQENWTDEVAMVERVRDTDTVYDIQVSRNSNFFAGGVLVHNCMIIDDPHKDAAEARSETVRNSVWDWYLATASTRLEPGGAIIIVMARWHEDDLAGRLAASNDGNWEILNLPAIAEEDEEFRKKGEALWPERYDVETLLAIKKQSEFWFASLYQGRPSPEDGNIYRKSGERHWSPGMEEGQPGYILKKPDDKGNMVYDRFIPEAKCSNFITVDLAVSEKQSADYTVMTVWAATPQRELILLDMVRRHMTAPEKVPTMQRLKDRYQASYLAIERFGYQLETIQQARWSGLPIHESAMKGDKVAKSWESSAKWESGQIFLPSNAAFLDDIRMEIYAFPNAAHDDICDTFAIAASEVSRAGDPLEAMGIVICAKCQNRFIQNAKVGLDRPCPKCLTTPKQSRSIEMQPGRDVNSLS